MRRYESDDPQAAFAAGETFVASASVCRCEGGGPLEVCTMTSKVTLVRKDRQQIAKALEAEGITLVKTKRNGRTLLRPTEMEYAATSAPCER